MLWWSWVKWINLYVISWMMEYMEHLIASFMITHMRSPFYRRDPNQMKSVIQPAYGDWMWQAWSHCWVLWLAWDACRQLEALRKHGCLCCCCCCCCYFQWVPEANYPLCDIRANMATDAANPEPWLLTWSGGAACQHSACVLCLEEGDELSLCYLCFS